MTYYRNQKEIQQAIDASAPAVRRWLSKPGCPKRTKSGWPKTEMDMFCRAQKAAGLQAQRGPNVDLKRRKLEKEIALLDERIRIAALEAQQAEREAERVRGELITKRERNDILMKHGAIVKPVLERLPGEIGDICGDPAVVKAVRVKCNAAIEAIGAECEKAGI